MFAFSPLFFAWIRKVLSPFWVSLLSMVVVSSVVVTGQWVLRAPVVPSPVDIVRIWLGLAPEMIGFFAPVALLFASVTGARLWAEGGEIRALGCAGQSSLRLLRVGLATGLAVGVGVALCTHLLAPVGRADARETLAETVATAPLRAKTAAQLGDVWVRVDRVDDGVAHDVVIATGDWLAWAKRGQLNASGLLLEDGEARPLSDEWTLRYKTAQFPIASPQSGTHNFERSSRALWRRVLRLESRGKSSTRERLTLHKRTSLAVSAPLFGLLGIPLGLAFRRPAWITGSVVAVVWIVQRLGDHLAPMMGAEIMAVLPLVLLAAATWTAWRSVRGML